MQFLNRFKLFIVHNAACVRQNLPELIEVLLLEQEHHVVRQNEGVAWTHVHGLLKRHLCILDVRCALKRQCQVAEGLLVVRFQF